MGAIKNIFLTLVVLAFIIFLILFGTRIYFVVNYLLGEDVLINTAADTENIFLTHGESKEIYFKTSILANPFCRVECSYLFEDLSENSIYDSGNLSVKLTEPITKKYTLTSPTKGIGQRLYRFNTLCTAIKTPLCDTKGILTGKSVLLTLDYNYTLEEEKIRDSTLKNYPLYLNLANNLTKEIYGLEKTIQKIENISTNEYHFDWTLIENENKGIPEQMQTLTLLWDSEKLFEVGDVLSEISTSLTQVNLDFQELNKSVIEEVENYNALVLNISVIEDNLKKYGKLNFTKTTASELDDLIVEFNSLKNSFLIKESVSDKEIHLGEFYSKYNILKTKLEEEIIGAEIKDSKISKAVSNVPLELISLGTAGNLTFINYKLTTPATSCCLKGKCSSCCDDSCNSNPSFYPIVLVHGHDFSASISPEYSLEIFSGLRNKLEEDGYIYAGSMLITSPEFMIKGIWGEMPSPISVGGSYYFDTISNQSSSSALQSKEDNIDTYSIRLKNIIDGVKYKTNKDKVIIISHSMGGLVTRRYVQLFGDDSIDKIIIVASPNNGVVSDVSKLCKLFGAERECEDMDESSVLINKLSIQKGFNIPVYNIIGVGCNTYGNDGDGIVTNKSAYLSWANNYYITGTCQNTALTYLHSEVINPYKYPQIYEIIKNILKGNK